MGRETSPYIVGDCWLDKRRDGRSRETWQIASYDPATRSISYRSTRRKGLDDAKGAIHAHVEAARAKRAQAPEDATVIPLLVLYWQEHGRRVVSPAQIASSIRCFMAFLMQDEAGASATVADLTPQVFARFRAWRMGPHAYDVPWGGKDFRHRSDGVRGESVQRNLDDIRAALNHHAENGRLPYSPKVPSVPKEHRSPARDTVLSIEELGAIVAFARDDIDMMRFVLLMIGTGARPEAASLFDPRAQWDDGKRLVDLHPAAWLRTKKVNPVVPAHDELAAMIRAWAASNSRPAKSRKTAWRTMRRALGLNGLVVAKTIRHSVATRLRTMRVPAEEIETLLGHQVLKGTTAVYAKYDPDYLGNVREALTTIWTAVMDAATVWDAGHLRAKVGNGRTIVVAREAEMT